jgi:hypothetical protein
MRHSITNYARTFFVWIVIAVAGKGFLPAGSNIRLIVDLAILSLCSFAGGCLCTYHILQRLAITNPHRTVDREK